MVSSENLNKQLLRNRVLVFVVIRKKKPGDIPISDVAINERGDHTQPVPKGSKSIQYQLGPKKNRVMSFQKCNCLKAKFKPTVLDYYP